MVETNGEFRTTDTPLAAYLIQEGFDLLEIEYNRTNPHFTQAIFVFNNNSDHLRECERLYNRGEAHANLMIYERAKRMLIIRIKREMP